MEKDYIVKLQDIVVEYQMKSGSIKAVNNASLNIERGKITALVGESGSGKTTLASTILSCLVEPGVLVNGKITFIDNSHNVIIVNELSKDNLNAFRFEKASMVFQAAQSSLNPVMTVWQSYYETYHYHFPKVSKEVVLKKCKELLQYVKLDVDRVLMSYPHELSGGMKQRVMIAFSMLLDPDFIILDEPTTALDVITQDYIFRLLKRINTERNITMLLMTHDLNVVAKFSDYVGVMYAGEIVEFGKTSDAFKEKNHPYTEGLINATPSLYGDTSSLCSIPGNPPNLRELPDGCAFSPRCKYCQEICLTKHPSIQYKGFSYIKCHLLKEGYNERAD